MTWSESRVSPVIRALLIINAAVWVLQLIPAAGSFITGTFSLIPDAALHGQIWRLFTYGFLHDPHSVFHILFNMLGLWMFGSAVLEQWGERKFLLFYLSAILFCGIFSVIYLLFGQSPMILGASGGVLGIMALYALFYPDREILLFGMIPMKAWVTVVLFAVIAVGGMMSGSGGTAHLTHLGGIAFAFLWLYAEKYLERHPRKKRQKTIIHYFEPRRSRQDVVSDKEQVDLLLKKISERGIDSLSREEMAVLERASGKPAGKK